MNSHHISMLGRMGSWFLMAMSFMILNWFLPSYFTCVNGGTYKYPAPADAGPCPSGTPGKHYLTSLGWTICLLKSCSSDNPLALLKIVVGGGGSLKSSASTRQANSRKAAVSSASSDQVSYVSVISNVRSPSLRSTGQSGSRAARYDLWPTGTLRGSVL